MFQTVASQQIAMALGVQLELVELGLCHEIWSIEHDTQIHIISDHIVVPKPQTLVALDHADTQVRSGGLTQPVFCQLDCMSSQE